MASSITPPAPPAPDSLAALQGQDGLDIACGLAAVGGKPAVYRRLLGLFIDTHGAEAAAMRQLLRAGDLGALAAHAHHLRGSAATLGLIEIETLAAALEQAAGGRGPTLPVPELSQTLADALDDTVERLRRALLA
ncbi:MAG: Hpt domain-containing protein [Rubrivivax sp.]|nr:Hpt domain-containing protein [Rubrivivax sp.]